MSKTILIIAAEPREFQGLLSRNPVRHLQWGLQFSCEMELNGHRAVLVADGAGMQLAAAAADVARRHIQPDVLVSTGFCGALDPELGIADVFVATTVTDNELGRTFPAASVGPASRAGALVSVNRVANTALEKSVLRRSGAGVVEMEAGAIAGRAQIWNLPFYCIKSVSDTAADSFEMDFNQMRDQTGRFSRQRILVSALSRPWARIPSLLKLNRSCRMASKSLGDFLADCRF